MLRLRNIDLFVFFLLLFSTPLTAQSLFLEAQQIKELLEHDHRIRLDSLELAEWQVAFNGGTPQDLNASSFFMDAIGRYSFIRKAIKQDSLPPGRNLSVHYDSPTGLISKTIEVENLLEIYNMPDAISWTITKQRDTLDISGALSVTVEPFPDNSPIGQDSFQVRRNLLEEIQASSGTYFLDLRGRYIFSNPDQSSSYLISLDTAQITLKPKEQLIVRKKDASLIWFIRTDFQAERIEKQAFYDLISFLTVHAEYKADEFNYYTFVEVYNKYKNNPFMKDLLEPLLYSFDLDEVVPYMDFNTEKYSFLVNSILAKDYEWVRRLYDKEVLNFKEQVLHKRDVEYFQKLDFKEKIATPKLLASSEIAESEYAKVKTFDANSILEGLSDFIVDRAQEELNIAFMDRFKRRMTDEIPNEYNLLFPETYDLFLQFEISNYKKMLQSARQTFSNDLQSLGLNMPKLLLLDKYRENYQFSTEIYNLSLFYDMTRMVYNENPVEKILSFAYGHFVDRHSDLTNIVNDRIADNRLFYTPSYGYNTSPANKVLRKKVLGYSKNLRESYTAVNTAKLQLNSALQELRSDLKGTAFFHDVVELKEKLDSIDQLLLLFNYNYQGPSGQMAYDYFENYAGNYLVGKGYFNDLLNTSNTFNLKEYEENFSKPLTEGDYRAKGLDIVRLLEREPFDDALDKSIESMNFIQEEAREIKRAMILRRRNRVKAGAKQVIEEREILVRGINEELQFWKDRLGLDTTHFELAGLAYLRNLLIDNADGDYAYQWENLGLINNLLHDTTMNMQLDVILLNLELTKEEVFDWITGIRELLDNVRMEVLQQIENLEERNRSRLDRYLPNPVFALDFQEMRDAINRVDDNEFQVFDKVVEKLVKGKEIVAVLQTQQKSIRGEIKSIDQLFAEKTLIESRNNAINLAATTELAVHLLYSLSREIQKDVVVRIQDTTKVNYTIKEVMPNQIEFSRSLDSISISPVQETFLRPEETMWLDKSAFDSLTNDEVRNAVFLGLLYQQLASISGSPTFSTEGLAAITTKLINSVEQIKQNQGHIDRKKILNEKITFRDYFPFIKTTVELFTVVIETPFIRGRDLRDKVVLTDAVKVAKEGLALYQNINEREYGYAIYNAMEIFRTITDPSVNPSAYADTPKGRKDLRKRATNRNKIRNAILLYGTFMADVINAESSDDVKQALEAAAAPPGSSRVKRELEFNLSLNSYLGIGGGIERLLDADENAVRPTVGLSVPVGLAFSFKLPKSQRGSYSLFFPILDIGAVTAFRFDDTNNELPELEFKNFISPGAYLNYNFYKAPLTMGLGWQYGPQARGVDGITGKTSRSWRFLFNLTIDVPIFNLINGDRSTVRTRRKKGKKNKDTYYYSQPVITNPYN